MSKYYPINMDLAGRRCLVVGGGRVAERKIERLIGFGAEVRIISPEITSRIENLVRGKKLLYLKSKFSKSLLDGSHLVFAATNNTSLNRSIANEAKRRGILVNVAKPAEQSNFILPALITRKDFTVAVSTDGQSPERAKKVKEKLETLL